MASQWQAIGCFIFALSMGTCSTLSSKIMYGFQSINSEGNVAPFQKPLMQTFLMFLAMVCALPMHHIIQRLSSSKNTTNTVQQYIPMKKYLILAFPALFDLCGTALCMVGLLYVTVSTYQLIRCIVIVFVAILKYFVLKSDIRPYMWLGVFLNAFAIVLVSASAFADPSGADASSVAFGIGIILVACMVMSFQFVLEEVVMNNAAEEDDDSSSPSGIPPLVVVGMEGFWGTLVCIFIVFPLASVLPGNDVGNSLESFYDSLVMIQNNSQLQLMVVFYIACITGFNVSAIFVTFLMDSVWRSILANFRPIAVWGTDLVLFYIFTSGSFGEPWTAWSWMQLSGMILLFIGTAIYNASLRLGCFTYDESVIAKTLPITPSAAEVFNSPYITRELSMKKKSTDTTATTYGSVQGSDGKSRKSFKV